MAWYKTTVSIEILTDAPISDGTSLQDIGYQIEEGDWVGYGMQYKQVELTPKEMADALYEAGSEPGFFQLDADGNMIID